MTEDMSSVIGRFVNRLEVSLQENSFIRLVLSSPTEIGQPVLRIIGRLILLRGLPTLSLTESENRRDVTRNIDVEETSKWFHEEVPGRFRAALLESSSGSLQLSLPAGRTPQLISHRPPRTKLPDRQHDRRKVSALESSAQDWLHALGLTDAEGRPLPRRADKHRQIVRFSEILERLVQDCHFERDAKLRVTDMGCGRGYLTLAVWQVLHRQCGWPVSLTGIEARPELVAELRAIVEQLGLSGIEFQNGRIAEAPPEPVDVLIALHACNTATDEALAHGVRAGARLLIAAPCCHQELRPRLVDPPLLEPLLAHGILKERFSEWLTDGLRALCLQAAGYRTRLIEFVDPEHTPKNLLLTAVRDETSEGDEFRARARSSLAELKSHFGLGPLAFDTILNVSPSA